MKIKHEFKSEKDLCSSFSAHAQTLGWEVFFETSGFDLLLRRDGITVGIEAKLVPNILVLHQALPKWHADAGPHFHAVLVPRASYEFLGIAARLRICVIRPVELKRSRSWMRRHPYAEGLGAIEWQFPLTHAHEYPKAPWIPDINVLTPAGVKSPKVITRWKITAVKLCLLAETQGYLTLLDFEQAGLNIGTWVQRKWILNTGKKCGERRLTKYTLIDDDQLPHRRYPEIVAALQEKDTHVE